jgi:hypothetical protein
LFSRKTTTEIKYHTQKIIPKKRDTRQIKSKWVVGGELYIVKSDYTEIALKLVHAADIYIALIAKPVKDNGDILYDTA